jgi:hypothetical protein
LLQAVTAARSSSFFSVLVCSTQLAKQNKGALPRAAAIRPLCALPLYFIAAAAALLLDAMTRRYHLRQLALKKPSAVKSD